MSEARLIKFIGGEEIMASIVDGGSPEAKSIVVEDAVTLVYQQGKEGVTTGFAPFMPYAVGQIEISKSSIAASTDAIDEKVLSEYNRIFSKIVLAPTGIIT